MEINEITIPFEEYKGLLIIKGKYEELKEINTPLILYDTEKNNFIQGGCYYATKPNNV